MSNIIQFVKFHIRDIIFAGLFMIILGVSGFSLYLSLEKANNSIDQKTEFTEIVANAKTSEVKEEKTESTVFIDIKGAIKKPGVYEVKQNAIINDIITLAGGFNSNAYQAGINLSKKVKDEMVIYVYTKNEMKEKNNEIKNDTCKTNDYNICECIEKQESIIEANTNKNEISNGTQTEHKTTMVNINTASKIELTTITGIGEAKADAIIRYRQENGLFKAITDIMNVSGIGEALFAKIQDFITI